MTSQAVLYLLPYLFSVTISAGVGLYAWRHQAVAGARPFAWMALLEAVTTAFFVLELISPGFRAKIAWDDLQFVTTLLLPLSLLAFGLEYTGRRLAHPWRLLGILATPIALLALLLATDRWTGLIRPDARLVAGEPFAALVYGFTVPIVLLAVYGFVLAAVGIALLILFFVQSPRLVRIQIGVIIIGILFPLIGTALTLAGVSLGFHRDTMPFAAAIRNLLIAWALFRYHLLDVVPVAWSTVVANIADAVIVLDARSRVIDLNPAAQQLINATPSEMVGKPLDQALAGWPELASQCQSDTIERGEVTLRGAEVRHFDLSCVPLSSRQGQVTGHVMALRETTEQVRAQKALQQAHDELELRVETRTKEAVQRAQELDLLHTKLEQYAEGLEETVEQRTRELQAERDRTQAILETVGESVIVTDTAGRILYMNPATAALTGFARERIVGQHTWLWGRERQADQPWDEIRQALRSGQLWRGEIPGRRSDGTPFDAAVTIAPLFDPDSPGQFIGSVWVQRDITPLKEAERFKNQFISNVSHELRTPLSVITLTGDNLEAYYGRLDDEMRLSMIHDLRDYARVLNDLIGDVLEISRIDSGRISTERAVVNLPQLVRAEVERQRPLAAKRSQVLSATGPETLLVWANAGQVCQIIRNLLDNASKFTPQGGQIACICEAEHEQQDQPSPGRWAVLRVCDSGIGIEPEHLPHLFERFYRVHSQSNIPGTGLGLSIVQELVALHGGHVTVSSRAGDGTVFSVYLPRGEETGP